MTPPGGFMDAETGLRARPDYRFGAWDVFSVSGNLRPVRSLSDNLI